MKVAFVLPCSGRYPIGGFRIAYEHANWLARRGHDVSIFHATDLQFSQRSLSRKAKAFLLFLRNRAFGFYKPNKWFDLDAGVKTACLLKKALPTAHNFDVAVATAWQTAGPVASSRAQKKLYLVQHLEDWDQDAQSAMATWTLPLEKIAISRWLQQLVVSRGVPCDYVPNAIDTNFFYPKERIENRDPSSLLVQLHHKDWKGSGDALAAVKILRSRGWALNLQLFGLPDEKDFSIEGPYTYHRNPTQTLLRSLYSKAAIFVAASWSEGWGLTPHEAAACGAAVVATDINGHREFLEAGVSALLSSPKDPSSLADNIECLLMDDDLRQRIAQAGLVSAREFDWQKAAACFQCVLEGSSSPMIPNLKPE